MRYEIKAIGLWPFIKVSFFFNLVIGFLFGLFYALFAGFIITILSRLAEFQPEGLEFDFEPLPVGLLIVVLPILFAVMGAIFYTLIGVVLAAIYNLIARLVGGYELDLEAVPNVMTPSTGGPPLTGYTAASTYAPPPIPGSTPPASPFSTRHPGPTLSEGAGNAPIQPMDTQEGD
ncbi:MAG TPA: DUF3566 domain-containing protein [Candidatus Deferrimicrobium sp.]|nr:DUF3566 domain-containing protein [Candidatus Deferrimicrobium sp.]